MPATVLFLECKSYVIVGIYVAVGCVVNSHFSVYSRVYSRVRSKKWQKLWSECRVPGIVI